MTDSAPPHRPSVLVVDDDRSIRRTLEKFLGDLGYAVTLAEDGLQGLEAITAQDPDVVLLDLGLPRMDGLELLAKLREAGRTGPVIVITARDDMHSTVTAMHQGAWDYLVKPLEIERLKITVKRAVESKELTQRIDGLVETMARSQSVDSIVGRTPVMREVFKTIGQVSTSNATVLVTGESGTGKELVARAIHFASEGRDQPFVAVNCSSFPRDLLESELFGHARGAFTGATSDKAGRFQIVGAGTLFLDEIGELPLDLQAKLLRVVQERVFERLGDPRPIPLRARLVAATHRDLAQMVRQKLFREDLFYRLNVLRIHLPPLRERPEDIKPLVDHLVGKISRDLHKKIRYVSKDALEALTRYPWPGNVRELENALTRAMVLTQGEVLEAGVLPITVDDLDAGDASYEGEADEADATDASAEASNPREVGELLTLRELERRHITTVLNAMKWNKRRSCGVLGITRPTLDRKIRDYGIERPSAPDERA